MIHNNCGKLFIEQVSAKLGTSIITIQIPETEILNRGVLVQFVADEPTPRRAREILEKKGMEVDKFESKFGAPAGI